jgi:hypothetical protein
LFNGEFITISVYSNVLNSIFRVDTFSINVEGISKLWWPEGDINKLWWPEGDINKFPTENPEILVAILENY